MEAFEKYFNENYPLPTTIERGPIGRDFKKGCEQSWKAAFENMENWIRGRRCTGEDMLEYIYKELDRTT